MRTLLLILGFLITDPALTDPCKDHTVLDDTWRSTDCKRKEYSGKGKCDEQLNEGWYRFKSSGGWKIPETRVAPGHCSTHRSGWLQGSHPTLEQGEGSGTVCFNWDGNPCSWAREIKIKNCSSYFVYELKPTPGCEAAYCTDPNSVLTEPCVDHTVLNQPWRSSDCTGTECVGQWKCDKDLVYGWYRFNSSGGWKIPEAWVAEEHCSTHHPGWLQGSHPTLEQEEVNRTVCFQKDVERCERKREIKIKNCDGYFVYELKPTRGCKAAYCTDPGTAPTLGADDKTQPESTDSGSPIPTESPNSGKSTTRETGGKSTGKPTQQSSTVPADSSTPGKSTTREAGGKSTGKPTQQSSTVPVDSSAPGKSTTRETGGKSTGKPTQQSSTVPADSSTPGKSTTREAGGKSTGKPTQQSSTVPVDSSAPGKSTTREAGGKSTGKPTQQSSTVPVDSSAPGKSTTRETGGKSTGKPTQQSSTVPADSSTAGKSTTRECGGKTDQSSTVQAGSSIPDPDPGPVRKLRLGAHQTLSVPLSDAPSLSVSPGS
ncbi:uncharacterized protein LOC144488233 isoform X2 [Mustelus asterias]